METTRVIEPELQLRVENLLITKSFFCYSFSSL